MRKNQALCRGNMKKVLMLGGSLYQTFAIKKAKELGLHVITCDYLPDNPGHQFADEYYNVSTTDKEAVLALAKKLNVDGVVAYASDPAAPTAAYVCEKMDLPTSPYESVCILSEKDLFRKFLTENGFNVPKAVGCSSFEEAQALIKDFQLPVMIKPVDSSGSKGINKLTDINQLRDFVEDALKYSRKKKIIIEEFIVKKGYQISGDAFSVDGKLVFHCLGNEYYSKKNVKDFAPIGECWPFLMDRKYIDTLVVDLQRLISLLGMKSTAYNVEAIIGDNEKVYILELGARSGGSLIPQVTYLATGVDMVEYVIKAAIGESCESLQMAPVKGCWSNYMIHSSKTGLFDGFDVEESFKTNHLVDIVSDIKIGDPVHYFRDAQDCVAEAIVKYDTPEQMMQLIPELDQKIKVKTK